jgi:hypothetical protein
MAKTTSGALPVARSKPRSRTALLLESIALRHQIAVLERSGTRRPCFRLWDRMFWILLSRWWSQWRESLIIVQPGTVLRWRREGWSALWRYRSGGRWRGGRPRVSGEVRHLIVRMARENFLWGAPRIHGELLMLGFSVSQATVSPLAACTKLAAGPIVADLSAQSSQRARPVFRGAIERIRQSYWAKLLGSAAAQVAAVDVGLSRGLGRQPALKARRNSLRSAQCDRARNAPSG